MWLRTFVAVGCLMIPSVVFADSIAETITFTVPASDIGTNMQGPAAGVLLDSSALNGTVLSGQSLSLDLMLANNVLARLGFGDGGVSIGLAIDTNAQTFPGFTGPTSGYLIFANGSHLMSQDAGSADGCCPGALFTGFGFASPPPAGDFSGAHFDTSLPDNGFVIADLQLEINANGPYDSIKFGTAEQLPEPSTLVLLLLALPILFKRSIIR